MLDAVLLGVIEGVTEFLPISSTGHLLLAEQWLPRQSDFFNVIIQSGAVLAVVLFYWKRILSILLEFKKAENKIYVLQLASAFGITVVGGLIAKKMGLKLPETMAPVAWATLIGGVILLFAERALSKRESATEITIKVALIIGAAQVIAAIFPGSSRSGTTIIAAMFCGVDRKKATEFSFLLGIPTMFAAGFLQAHHALKESVAIDWAAIMVGTLVSGVVAFLAVKWLIGYLRANSFAVFGWYRIVVGAAMLMYFRA